MYLTFYHDVLEDGPMNKQISSVRKTALTEPVLGALANFNDRNASRPIASTS